MTRQVVVVSYGDDADIRLMNISPAELGPNEVRIAVRAACVNPSDWKRILGSFGRDPSQLPLRPGAEVSGVISEVGAEVRDFAIGEAVLGYRVEGGWADEVVTDLGNVFTLPERLSFDEAAGLLLAATTAWHSIVSLRVQKDSQLLVVGGSGAVGRMAVQLAEYCGAHVTATASPTRLDTLAETGATAVAHGDGLERRLLEALPHGADMALDTSGTKQGLDACISLVADPKRVATVAGFPYASELGVQMLGYVPGGTPGTEIRNQARQELVRLAGDGIISVEIGSTYRLSDIRKALEYSQSGRSDGKLIVHP